MTNAGGQVDQTEKIIRLLKSWQGKKPDYDHLDYSRHKQTEAEYQEEQARWMAEVKKKRQKKKNRNP